jgi:exopolysaccharide biosynthesis polyprenyl glycosylphosphotransferase
MQARPVGSPTVHSNIAVAVGEYAPNAAALPAPGAAPVPAARPRRSAAVATRDAFQRRALATSDAIAALLAFGVAVGLMGPNALRLASAGIVPVVVLAAKLVGLYDRDELLIHKTTADEVPAVFQLATVTALVSWLLEGVLLTGPLGHGQVLVLWVLLVAGTVGGRWLVRKFAERLAEPERCLLIGDLRARDRLSAKLVDQGAKAQIVARFDPTAGPRNDYDELEAIVESQEIHRVIMVPDHSDPDGIVDLVRAAKGLGVRVTVVPGILEVVGSTVAFDNIGGLPLLGVRAFGLSRSSRAVKRIFDLTLSSVALLVTAPLLGLVAVAVRLDSRGPVFFRQTRVGRDERRFRIFKFRTMVPDAESLKAGLAELNQADGLFKIDDDPRITRLGRFLRRSSLDELPQIFNVFLGHMSIVGPRPLILDEDARITGFDRRRLHLTPGMTGHWQILGSARVPMAEMVKIDYLYVAGWTLWADIKLLLRTIPYVLARRGQ